MERILVRAANWIGDVVMSLPALDAVKRLFPDARVTILAKPGVAPIFENNPSVADIFIYDSVGAHKGLNGRMRLAGELRAREFDCAVLFQNAFEAALIAFLAGIPRRVGYARDLRSVFLTDPVEVTAGIKEKHQVEYYLNIIKELGGAEVKDPTPLITLTKAEEEKAEITLTTLGIEKGRAIIGVSPGASYGPAKRWAPKNFSFVLNAVATSLNATVLIFGSDEDKEIAGEVSKGLTVEHHDLAGKTALREFMALARRLDLFLTNDSGPMHIGAALGTPTLAIFGSTSAELTGPLGARVSVVSEPLDCAPCFERVCPDRDYECLTSIDPKRVLEVALALLNKEKKEVLL
ncbi:MAG: lipopolysaccharide heptosyltransferase II [Thermodesulfobacteriota bacterium]